MSIFGFGHFYFRSRPHFAHFFFNDVINFVHFCLWFFDNVHPYENEATREVQTGNQQKDKAGEPAQRRQVDILKAVRLTENREKCCKTNGQQCSTDLQQ